MEGKSVAEFGNVVIAALAGFVGGMQCYAHIETDDQEVHVVAQSGAGTQCQLLGQAAQVEFGVGARFVLAQQPYVAGIQENGTVQVADDAEAVFQIGLQSDVAYLVDEGIALVAGRVVAAGAYAAFFFPFRLPPSL